MLKRLVMAAVVAASAAGAAIAEEAKSAKAAVQNDWSKEWDLDEGAGSKAREESGKGEDGSITHPTWTQSEPPYRYLAFDGASTWVTLPHLPIGAGSFTVEAWSKRTGGKDENGTVVASGACGWKQGFVMQHRNGGFWGELSDRAGAPGVYVQALNLGIEDGHWHHLALVVDRGAAMAYGYVDGSRKAEASIAGRGSFDPGTPTYIGRLNPLCGPQILVGSVTQLRITNFAERPDRIARTYRSGERWAKGLPASKSHRRDVPCPPGWKDVTKPEDEDELAVVCAPEKCSCEDYKSKKCGADLPTGIDCPSPFFPIRPRGDCLIGCHIGD